MNQNVETKAKNKCSMFVALKTTYVTRTKESSPLYYNKKKTPQSEKMNCQLQ
jgi:hypothetical protein